jgi:signal peptidase I
LVSFQLHAWEQDQHGLPINDHDAGINPVLVSMHQKGFEPDNNRNIPGTMFFAAYVGPSMNPTLREPEMLEIVPNDNRPLRVGDVVFFLPPQNDQPVVHRIVRVTPAGMSTLGDNNTQEDTFLLQPKDIKGQVVAAWRGQKRRKIAGGLQGRLTSRWCLLCCIPFIRPYLTGG